MGIVALAVFAAALSVVAGCGGRSARPATDAADTGAGGDRAGAPDAAGDVGIDTVPDARGDMGPGLDAAAADAVVDAGATIDVDAAIGNDGANLGDAADAGAATDSAVMPRCR